MAARVFLFLFIVVSTAAAQEVGENKSGRQAATTFKASSHIVIETVSVTGKNGAPVVGLRKDDFTVTEDGKPQTISVFEYQNLENAATAPPVPLTTSIAPLPELPSVRIVPETEKKVRYHDRRLLVLYFDMDAIDQNDKARVFDAAEKFVRTEMTESDLLSVMMYDGGSIHVLEDFSEDKERILAIIQTLVAKEFRSFSDDIEEADIGAFGQNNSEFNIFNTDRQLSALQTAAQMLGALSEKRRSYISRAA